MIQIRLIGRFFVIARQKIDARRRLAEGIDRSRRLVERYRALLVQLHDPSAGAPALRQLPAGQSRRLRPSGGSSG
jgi:hypothetical protein